MQFTYTSDKTPVIDSILPMDHANVRRALQHPINITGRGFSDNENDNIVLFGGYPCDVLQSSSMMITCLMNASSEPPMNTWLKLSVLVKNHGRASVNIPDQYESSIIFQHSIVHHAPTMGSFAGGSTVNMKGYGLDVSTLEVHLTGQPSCEILSRSYTEMNIKMPEIDVDSSSIEKIIFVEDSSYSNQEQTLGNSPSKIFTYRRNLTAIISSISPSEFSAPNEKISIDIQVPNGINKDDLKVYVGNKMAETYSYNSGMLVAHIPSQTAGKHKVSVQVGSFGYAELNKTISNGTDFSMISILPILNNTTPTKGSKFGNTKVLLTGTGFIPQQTTVNIGGKDCIIDSINETHIYLTTPEGTGVLNFIVKANGVTYEGNGKFEFADSATPTIASLSPEEGVGGDTLTLNGAFVGAKEDYEIISHYQP